MKLHLAAMAALTLALGALSVAPDATAGNDGGGPENTRCVRVKMGPYYHQRCEVTYFDENGEPYVRVYWIDQNGQWYLPAD
ncbi:hypothetical protein [uncultured Stenotrophomonas sp.]|uniref:hypothetical protein n=1 Tax=uncultured Stenotrophomonas sp. TaxID=165438 RepID=UPI0025E0B165|nr:hypothetical protein [uncultured Stenotrophomonas sp.]